MIKLFGFWHPIRQPFHVRLTLRCSTKALDNSVAKRMRVERFCSKVDVRREAAAAANGNVSNANWQPQSANYSIDLNRQADASFACVNKGMQLIGFRFWFVVKDRVNNIRMPIASHRNVCFRRNVHSNADKYGKWIIVHLPNGY